MRLIPLSSRVDSVVQVNGAFFRFLIQAALSLFQLVFDLCHAGFDAPLDAADPC